MTLDPTAQVKDENLTPAEQNLQPGSEETSVAEQLTSKIEEGKQYSGKDVIKMIGDALSANGRAQKNRAEKAEGEVKRLSGELETVNTSVTTLTSQMAGLVKAQNDAELEKVKDDPIAQGSLRARQANAAEALRLESVEATQKANETKLAERETEVKNKEASINIRLAAITAGVDEKTLADLVPDGDSERLKKAANVLKQSKLTQEFEIDPKTGKPVIDPSTGKPKPAALSQTPASAISAGAETKSAAERMLDKAKKK